MTTGPFWTRQKRLEAFWTSYRNLIEGIISKMVGCPKSHIQYILDNMMRKNDKWTPDKRIDQIIIYYMFQLEIPQEQFLTFRSSTDHLGLYKMQLRPANDCQVPGPQYRQEPTGDSRLSDDWQVELVSGPLGVDSLHYQITENCKDCSFALPSTYYFYRTMWPVCWLTVQLSDCSTCAVMLALSSDC